MKDPDQTVEIKWSQAQAYLDGEVVDDLDTAIDKAQDDAKIKGAAQTILITINAPVEDNDE